MEYTLDIVSFSEIIYDTSSERSVSCLCFHFHQWRNKPDGMCLPQNFQVKYKSFLNHKCFCLFDGLYLGWRN